MKKAIKPMVFVTIMLMFLVACKSTEKLIGLKPAPLADTKNWKYEPTISDEFNGSQFDTIKWYDTNPTWIGRAPSLFRPSNVALKDGWLVLTGKRENVPNAPEGYHTFTSAAVQSKRKVLYGYFEIKCKPMNSALSSAFWLYTPDSVKQEEIDIFEICGRNDTDSSYEHTYFATTHYIVKPEKLKISDHVAHKTTYKLADTTIVAGLKWTREEIVWYLNGKEIRKRKNDFWHSPETINFDSEAFPTWWGLPSDEDNGGTFEIDYFRYWSQINESDKSYIN
ncbi:family 16 glycosylhydrolase [Allomuricauda sp. SCSIO 65647]|uniref:family 16 glycosylhydrolase n=1 Tax=Allomuricauda sp. SCSIO 65647 TaxID=2908843 RepID=UPI001F2067C4|nr:family 16 glycosylhydrolase [Muricauda sp. SCSIO 65647]UJH66853.1 family 16 glycosylhydrolase [Muricauda sp. SCSIO 65647]